MRLQHDLDWWPPPPWVEDVLLYVLDKFAQIVAEDFLINVCAALILLLFARIFRRR